MSPFIIKVPFYKYVQSDNRVMFPPVTRSEPLIV